MTLLYGWLSPPERVVPAKRNGGSHRPDWVLSDVGIFTISHESINQQITQLNTEFIQAYEEKYRALLQLTGSTFETIDIETQRQADSMLSFGKACNRK